MSDLSRCPWARDALDQDYHDHQWCRPCHDDATLFELLELEGFQAGLSWHLILERREALKAALARFDPAILANWTEEEQERALAAPGVIRHRGKIRCAVSNARAFLAVQKEFSSFDTYLWSWVQNKPQINHWVTPEEVPTQTTLSQALSADLKRRGFRFVGPVIVYSYLQAAGLVNDHLLSCPWHPEHPHYTEVTSS